MATSMFQLYPDALQDSQLAAYALLVVAPASALASRLLLWRGKRTTPGQVYLLSFLVPAALVLFAVSYYRDQADENVYRLLSMSRGDDRYQCAKKFAFLRHKFTTGEMSAQAWARIDAAYDHIYNEQARYIYDFWGPGHEKMTLEETLVNVSLFYVLWILIINAVTSPQSTRLASRWSFSVLLILMCFEVTVRMMKFDPVITEAAPFMTPREFLLWCHWFIPIFVFAMVSIKSVFYVDMDKHQQKVLRHMLEKNKESMEELKNIEKELNLQDENADEGSKKKN